VFKYVFIHVYVHVGVEINIAGYYNVDLSRRYVDILSFSSFLNFLKIFTNKRLENTNG
jgi:hypothetical protein